MAAETDKYYDLVRWSPYGVLLLVSGVIQAANDDAVETMGIPKGRLLGVALADLLLPQFEASWSEILEGASAKTATLDVRLSRALAPVELGIRELEPNVQVVSVRSRDDEYRYSALAAGDLTHDQVTGLPNRYQLLTQMQDRVAAPNAAPLALVALWVDDLPSLSSKGELIVDRVVREVGERLQGRLRTPDVLGRFDEAGFLGLLTSTAPTDQLTTIAERLRAEVAFPVEVNSSLVSFTASVAVASINGRRPSTERALAQLEAAANRAKAGGGDRTEVLEL